MQRLSALMALLPSLAMAQSLVSTSPQDRTVLIEDLTGVNCQYCPDGHAIMNAIEAAEPARVNLLAIHAGVFATPAWTTPWGDDIDAFYNPSGYPSGGVNRHTFPAGLTLGRNLWESGAQEVLAMPSPVNLGLASTYDANTHTATIQVELLYTSDSPGGSDRVSVVLTESGIIAAQSYTSGTIANYVHNHVFRASVTPDWGEEVTSTTAGSTQILTFTYEVPDTWDVANFEVVAFVGEDQSDVYQARTVELDGGTTLVIGDLINPGAGFAGASSGTPADFGADMTNLLGAGADYDVTLETVVAPADWSGSFTVAGNTYPSTATVNVADGATEGIDVSIAPGATAGVGRYRLVVSAPSAPSAPVLTQEFSVISGVTDLIVSSPMPEAQDAQARYQTGLADAGNENFAAIDRNEFMSFYAANALTGVVNIYRNVSWTFPSLVDDEVAALTTMMDGGVNLMIAGQDIAWDQSGADGSYGTAATQAFFASHMLAEYVADGSTTNTPVNFEDGDAVFGGLASSPLANVFAGNTYPEEITPIAPATAIFKYGNTAKIGGLRAQTANYKLVYLGVGPEQFSNAAVGTAVVTISHDWFYGLVGVEEFDATVGRLGQPYPVPANERITVPMGLEQDATLQLLDATGRLVLARNVQAEVPQVELSTRGLANGSYTLRLLNNDGQGSARSIIIAH